MQRNGYLKICNCLLRNACISLQAFLRYTSLLAFAWLCFAVLWTFSSRLPFFPFQILRTHNGGGLSFKKSVGVVDNAMFSSHLSRRLRGRVIWIQSWTIPVCLMALRWVSPHLAQASDNYMNAS